MNARFGKLSMLAGNVSARSQMLHDFRVEGHIPGYVNIERLPKNIVLATTLAFDNPNSKESFCDLSTHQFRSEDVIKEVLEVFKKEVMDDYVRYKKQKFQSKTKPFLSGVLTFTDKEKPYLEKYSENLDWAALQYVDYLCKKFKTKVVYLVRHDDEKTPHYHFMLLAYDFSKHTTIKLNKIDLSIQQTECNKIFKQVSPMFQRGQRKSRRKHTTRAEYLDDLEREKEKNLKIIEMQEQELKKYREFLKKKGLSIDDNDGYTRGPDRKPEI